MTDPKASLPVIDKSLCTECGACVAICPTGAITGVGLSLMVSDACTRCAECEDTCPTGAIQVPFIIRWEGN